MKLRDGAWPVFGWTDDMRPVLARARDEGRTVALATIVALEGSAPRLPGTQMVFDGASASGHFSGGCIEADVANHAAQVVRTGEPALLRYGRNSPWIDIRLTCGSGMEILVERIAHDDPGIARLLDLSAKRSPAIYNSDGRHRTIDAHADAPCLSFAREPLRLALSHVPPWRLIVVGGDPTALAIAQLATQAGLATTLLCPGGPQSPPPIGCVDYCSGDPLAALKDIAPDSWTAVALALHEPDIEHRLLIAALRTDAGYVGGLGAAARLAGRRKRLEQAGLSPSDLARMHAPMGLARCGKAPWEVAVSVIAEVLETREAAQARAFRSVETARDTMCR